MIPAPASASAQWGNFVGSPRSLYDNIERGDREASFDQFLPISSRSLPDGCEDQNHGMTSVLIHSFESCFLVFDEYFSKNIILFRCREVIY